MKCEDIMKALALHLDGEDADEQCAAFLEHMAGCERCRLVVDTTKMTVALYRGAEPAIEIPEDCRKRLDAALLAKWQERGS